jgi:hypothetical protein
MGKRYLELSEMYENAEDWDKNVPADLLPAIKALRESFDEAHWGCGITTKTFCYSLLHNEAVDDPAKEYINYLTHIKARVGPGATLRFHDLIKQGTPPAIFKGFYDLYLDGVGVQALIIFKELAEIGRTNEKRLGIPHLEWAASQTKHMIRSHNHQLDIWVRDVCDKQPYDPNEDDDEQIFWLKWQAPRLLIMKPSRFQPYVAGSDWERLDAETSLRLRKALAENYVLHLEIQLDKVAGQAAVQLAKQPKPVPTDAVDSSLSQSGDNRHKPTTARREARKLGTQAKYKSWQREYRSLKKNRPDMSDVWYSQQIAKMVIGKGSSAETIRKRMKK